MTIRLNWTPSISAVGQRIEMSNNNVYTSVATVSATLNSYDVPGLNDNTVYNFRIITLCPDNTEKISPITSQVRLTCPVINTSVTDSSASYSFGHLGGSVSSYTVQLLNQFGNSIIETQSKGITNPISGTFSSLNSNTNYNIRVTVTAPIANKVCPLYAITTNQPFTWVGINPVCQTQSSCSSGGRYNPSTNLCEQMDYQTPTVTTNNDVKYLKVSNNAWGLDAVRVYKQDHNEYVDIDIPSSQYTQSLNTFWRNGGGLNGAMNRHAVWMGSTSIGQIVTIQTAINNSIANKVVYVGVSGDNTFELFHNSFRVAYADTDIERNLRCPNWPTPPSPGFSCNPNTAFKIFHLFPIVLSIGGNSFFVKTVSRGSAAGLAMIIIDNTESQIINATSDSDITYRFRSDSLENVQGNTYTCNTNYILNYVNNAFVCEKVLSTNNPIQVNTGQKSFTDRQRSDGFIEPNTQTGGLGPYFPSVIDTTTCPPPQN